MKNLAINSSFINGICNNSLVNNSDKVLGDNSTSSNYTTPQTYRLAVSVMVYLLGTTGNGLVIWFCVFRMVKTVNVVWILNLAIADFSLTFCLPLRITYFALNSWPFGNFMCKLYLFLYFLNLTVSVLQLMVISVDRFICVYFPVWSKNHRRLGLAVIIAKIIWVISTLFSVTQFIFQNTSTNNPNKTSCPNNLGEKYKWKEAVNMVCLFLVPFPVILFCYTAITVRIKRKGITLSSRPYKIFVAIIIAFFVCFFPYNFFLLLQLFGSQKSIRMNQHRKQIARCLMIANTCINPILYILIGQDFKEKFCSSIHTAFEKAFTEDAGKVDSREEERRRRAADMNSHEAYKIDIRE